MSGTVPVYINAQRVDIPTGATVLDAVRQWSIEAADEVSHGARVVTDSRGLPAPPDAPVYGGAIFRITAARGTAADEGSPG